jgi:ABC-type molybdenum transport system ATPase subunit/photorepair protein PhrA
LVSGDAGDGKTELAKTLEQDVVAKAVFLVLGRKSGDPVVVNGVLKSKVGSSSSKIHAT